MDEKYAVAVKTKIVSGNMSASEWVELLDAIETAADCGNMPEFDKTILSQEEYEHYYT